MARWLLFFFVASAPVWAADRRPDCVTQYLAVCGNVPLVETAVRACINSHRSAFSAECLAVAQGYLK